MAGVNDNLIPPKKGEVRNPKGRGKGVKNRATIARKWLEVLDKAKNPVSGEDESMSFEDRMTLSLIRKALKGDTQAYKALMDSAYGQPKQDIDIEHSGGMNIQPIEWVKNEDKP